MSKEQHWSRSPPLLMWMYGQVRTAAETRAESLSTWPTAPACAHCAVSPQATTTTHKECPMCYITNERSNINVHHRLSEQAVNHSEFNVFQLRDHPESTPLKLCFHCFLFFVFKMPPHNSVHIISIIVHYCNAAIALDEMAYNGFLICCALF